MRELIKAKCKECARYVFIDDKIGDLNKWIYDRPEAISKYFKNRKNKKKAKKVANVLSAIVAGTTILSPGIADGAIGDSYKNGTWDTTNSIEKTGLVMDQETYNTFILTNAKEVSEYFSISLDGYDKIGLFDEETKQFIGRHNANWNDSNSSNPVSLQIEAHPLNNYSDSVYFPQLSLKNWGGSERVKIDLEVVGGDPLTMTFNQWGLLTNNVKQTIVEGILPEPNLLAIPIVIFGGMAIYRKREDIYDIQTENKKIL